MGANLKPTDLVLPPSILGCGLLRRRRQDQKEIGGFVAVLEVWKRVPVDGDSSKGWELVLQKVQNQHLTNKAIVGKYKETVIRS